MGIEESIKKFISICDEAEAIIGEKEVSYTPTDDVSSLLDLFVAPVFEEHSVGHLTLKRLEETVSVCTLCRLHETRTKTVFGSGVANPKLLVIGEGPGSEEDQSGEAFVGRAGKYLDTWLSAIGLSRTNGVYITNIVKCRPPDNRDPQSDEIKACLPYLKRQIQLLNPQVILLLGKVAANTLLERSDTLSSMRGTFHRIDGIPTLVTYHPAAVLRDQGHKRAVWEDLKKIAAFLNIALPRRS